MLVKHLPDFAGHSVFVDWNIQSDYSEEMSQKSIVVRITMVILECLCIMCVCILGAIGCTVTK